MLRKTTFTLFALALLIAFVSPSSSRAASNQQPNLTGSPYELINAVNALRASNGLSPYSISSILMYTAQSHADFMAATGNVSHTGAGGSSVTDRLLSAGYPLAGDLSLGGFRSENITGGSESMSAQSAVNQWTGDAAHLNTMLSPNLTEIGAGVSINGGRVYYVIDVARPTTSGAPQSYTPAAGGASGIPLVNEVIFPVVVVTPNSEGDVIHEVKAGQTLWQIAIAYGVKIDDIKSLNGLFDNNIYPGEKLLVNKETILPTVPPVTTSTITATSVPTSTITATTVVPLESVTTTPVSSTAPNSNQTIMTAVMGIITLALLGGGIFSWMGNSSRNKGDG